MSVTTFPLLFLATLALPAWFSWDPLLPYFTAVFLLALGVSVVIKKAPPQARWLDKIVLCGPLFIAMPMAVFGTEHFLAPKAIGGMIPAWIPAHHFWVYFVGTCLILGGLSIVVQIRAGLSAGLFGVMILLFELFMHIPNVAAEPHNRFAWAIVFRELTFSWGALAFAATQTEEWRIKRRHWIIPVARVVIGVALVFYAVEHFLHPEFAPGVPLNKLTPTWIPAYLVWSYLTGAIYAAAGVCLITNKKARLAATWTGLWALVLVVIICVPIMLENLSNIAAGLNYPADTLMFSGAILCLAGSEREKPGAPAV
ncbi:MAG: hypothetical protein ACRD5M_14405 [Candidatus Acidiferrales bacterium]